MHRADSGKSGRPWKRRRTLACFLAAVLTILPVLAEVDPSEAKFLIICKMVEYFTWADESGKPANSIEVFVLGTGDLEKYILSRKPNYSVKGRPIHFTQIRDLSRLETCHILLVGESESKRFPAIVAAVQRSRVVAISDTPGFCRHGGHVNLYIENQRIRFEMNPRAASSSGVKISSRLLQLAKIVE